MKSLRLTVFLLIFALHIAADSITWAAPVTDKGAVLYVSSAGAEGADGSMQRPYKTIQKARDAIRRMKSKGTLPRGGIIVYICDGEYRINETIEFGLEDSGTEDAPITYRAADGAKVYISGATALPVNKFTPVTNKAVIERLYPSVRNKILQINLRDIGITEFAPILKTGMGSTQPDPSSLVVDDRLETLARWPNGEYALTGTVMSQGTGSGNGSVFEYEGKEPERWTNAHDIWFRGYWFYDWCEENFALAELDTKEKTIKLDDKPSFGITKGVWYYAYNLLEEIDVPGEWYLDRSKCILYYYPPYDLKDSRIRLTLMDKPLIRMTDCSYINFSGITFENTCESSIIMTNTKNCKISDCTIRNNGGRGIIISNGNNCGVKDSTFYDLGKGGVDLDGGDRATLTNGNNYVENCYFTRFSLSAKVYTPAVMISGCGNRISHNVIHDSPHEGIGFSGNKHIIEYNEMYDLLKETSDAGAIYGGADWTARGNVFINNIFHDNRGYSVYYDDAISGNTLQSNLFFNCSSGTYIHGGREFIIDSNIFANCGTGISITNISKDQAMNPYYPLLMTYNSLPITSDVWTTAYPSLANIINDEPELAKYNSITNSIFYNTRIDIYALKEAIPTGTFENNISFTQDPGFIDAPNGIYKLRDDFDKIPGFKKMDYDNVGLTDKKVLPPKSLCEFKMLTPPPEAENVPANNARLYWQNSLGAVKYRVTIAKDKYFTNIISEEETKETIYRIKNLEYGGIKYYWKVQAIGTSVTAPELNVNPQIIGSFTTALKEIVESESLREAIEDSNAKFNEVEVGTNPGQCPQQAKDEFLKAIEAAKSLLVKEGVTQAEVDNEIITLKAAEDKFYSTIISGEVDLGMLIAKKSEWVAVEEKSIKADGKSVVFTPKNGELVAAYKNIVPNYPIWKFKAKFNLSSGWQGFGLRSSDRLLPAWSAPGYLIIVKDNVLEYHRFSTDSESFEIPNDGIIKSGKVYDIELGAIDHPDGVRVIFKVDGETIFDYVDKGNYIARLGYFTLYSSAGEALEITTAESIKK